MKVLVLSAGTLTDQEYQDACDGADELEIRHVDGEISVEELSPADVVVVDWRLKMRREIVECLEGTRLICVPSTGFDHIDVDAARDQGIDVSNVPDYATESVAQTTFDHITRFESNLEGKTIGLVGLGAIGARVAEMARERGMEVVVYTRNPDRVCYPDISFVCLDELLNESDIVSLHVPLSEETEGLIGQRELSLMKPSAVLINTARGGLVDENALSNALESGDIAGAGLDVVINEPVDEVHPLVGLQNCNITPHIGWTGGRAALLDGLSENVHAFARGEASNVVNRSTWEVDNMVRLSRRVSRGWVGCLSRVAAALTFLFISADQITPPVSTSDVPSTSSYREETATHICIDLDHQLVCRSK